MGEFKDFDISYCGWTKGNWDLNYKGESKDMVIPKELIDGCDKEVACVRISSSTGDIESIYLPENVLLRKRLLQARAPLPKAFHQ